MLTPSHRRVPLAFAVSFFLVALGIFAFSALNRLPLVIASLPTLDGTSIVIETKRLGGASRPLYYRVVEDGVTVVPATYFDTLGDVTPRYTTVSDGAFLFGVIDEHEPNLMLLMHDFSTGETWPRRALADDGSIATARGKKMIAALHKAHPNTSYSLLIFRCPPVKP